MWSRNRLIKVGTVPVLDKRWRMSSFCRQFFFRDPMHCNVVLRLSGHIWSIGGCVVFIALGRGSDSRGMGVVKVGGIEIHLEL